MRKTILSLVLSALTASHAFGGTHRVLSFDDRSVTVELSTGRPAITYLEHEGEGRIGRISLPGYPRFEQEGAPLLPARRLHFEVPSPRDVSVEIIDLSVAPLAGVLPEILLTEDSSIEKQRDVLFDPSFETWSDFVRFSGIGVFRGTYVALVDVFPIIFDKAQKRLLHAERIVVRVTFPPARVTGEGKAKKDLLDGLTVNREQASGWGGLRLKASPSQRTPFEFALADHWIKIRVAENGIYAVTYDDLLGAGVTLGAEAIDPGTFRLFSGGPLSQPDALDDGGSYRDDYHLVEHSILLKGNGTGEFVPGDSILFYGVAPNGWMDGIDPSSEDTKYYKHVYDPANVYWLTWGEGDFTGDPRRIESRTAAPETTADTIEVRSYEERMHVERDLAYDGLHTDDRWYWKLLKGAVNPNFPDYFYTRNLVEGSRGRIRTIGYGPFDYKYLPERARVSLNGLEVGEMVWTVEKYFVPSKMTILDTEVANLLLGRNKIEIRTLDDMYVQWYEIFYRRYLRALDGMLDFFAPDTVKTARFYLSGYSSDEVLLFDVTNHESPVLLVGWDYSLDEIRFEDDLDGTRRHYTAVSSSAVDSPVIEYASGRPGGLPSLRDETSGPDMVIIYHERFEDAASTIRGHRMTSLPLAADPVVLMVDVEDVYNNFSNGMKDPIAIRNYLKFLYDNYTDNGEPVIKYVLLVGSGTYDPRNNLGLGSNYSDFVPLHINIIHYLDEKAIEDDDYFTKLDDGTVYGRDIYPDLAIGRMAVVTKSEADIWAQQIIDYESDIHLGSWRNKVILIADDTSPERIDLDFSFLEDSEIMSADDGFFPRFIDFFKIYLHHYPLVGDIKPGARNDLNREWSEGALIINYIGHGSNKQLADEWVFLKSDIPSLTNGPLRPLFLAFSCTVGDLEDPFERSMARELISSPAGGALAAITGADPTNYWGNTFLHRAIFQNLFTSRDSTGTLPVGTALLLGKLSPLASGYEKNNAMYHLLGDPAYKLAVPAYTVEHETAALDTMYTGNRYRLSGSVMNEGRVFSSFNGTAEVVIQEAEARITKQVMWRGNPRTINYRLDGGEFYRGDVEVRSGRFSIDFTVPIKCRTGPRARVRTYVRSSGIDGIGACDTLMIAPSGTKPPNDGPPVINMFFAGQATKVKQGARLIAEISDSNGIAVLGANPQSSIFLEFDRSGFPVFVTDYFTYDYGSATKGRVEYPLHSGFSPGEHSVIIRAFDNLGESSTDTLAFEVVEAGLYTVSDVFNFPNPVTDGTNFVFQVSSAADVRLKLFNVSGVTIWEEAIYAEEGFNGIYWNGRDLAGDRPANGTYIYVLEVEFRDSFNRKETVKGKVVVLR
jgi:hypothetical protein